MHLINITFSLQAVKLGTITAEGKADVYSYAEDNMVNDPQLQKHLVRFFYTQPLMYDVWQLDASKLSEDLKSRLVCKWSGF